MTEKRSWYDGWFYAFFIDRQKSRLRRKILRAIPDGKKILDIGCGTGGLSLDLAEKSSFVLGIDVSASQISRAEKRRQKNGQTNIAFKHADATMYGEIGDNFDYSILILMLHEIKPEDRLKILNGLKPLTNKIMILDYAESMPYNFWGISTRLIEFLAGKEHYRNFKLYLMQGGMISLLHAAGFRIENSRLDRSKIFRFITAAA